MKLYEGRKAPWSTGVQLAISQTRLRAYVERFEPACAHASYFCTYALSCVVLLYAASYFCTFYCFSYSDCRFLVASTRAKFVPFDSTMVIAGFVSRKDDRSTVLSIKVLYRMSVTHCRAKASDSVLVDQQRTLGGNVAMWSFSRISLLSPSFVRELKIGHLLITSLSYID